MKPQNGLAIVVVMLLGITVIEFVPAARDLYPGLNETTRGGRNLVYLLGFLAVGIAVAVPFLLQALWSLRTSWLVLTALIGSSTLLIACPQHGLAITLVTVGVVAYALLGKAMIARQP